MKKKIEKQSESVANSNRFTFTRKTLNDLRPPTKGWAYHYDDAERGLVIGVGATGVKSFAVYRKFGHVPVRITLGLFDPELPETRELMDGVDPLDLLGNRPSLNVRCARRMATAVNRSLDSGINPALRKEQLRQEKARELTLGKLFASYKDYLIGERRKGVSGVVWCFEKYLGALPSVPRKKHGRLRIKGSGSVNWQDRPLSAIQRADVSRLRLALAEHISPTTANRVIELLKAIYNFGQKDELYAGDNPAANLPKFKLQSRERRIESHEAHQFMEALRVERDIDFQDYVYLSICTGARRGNLIRMAWKDISLEGAAWRVSGERMKNGDPIVIPLIPKALEILRRRATKAKGNPWVFPGDTAEGHAGPFRKQWARFLKSAGPDFSDLRVHDLRRTLGSWMTSTGANTVMTMRALGHKTIDAALVYQRLEIGTVRDAMQHGVIGLLQAAQSQKRLPAPAAARVANIRMIRRKKAVR